MHPFKSGFFFLILLLFSACKKTELETVLNNRPPPDPTIEQVTITNYINRTYILVLGREPDSLEMAWSSQLLTASEADSASRSTFLDSVFSDSGYLPRVYNDNRIDLLNNMDTAEFTQSILLFQLLLLDSAYLYLWPALQYEIDRLTLLQHAFGEFSSGIIRIQELQKRMCNNYEYDQINMGSANFVISTFQHLVNRNPTMSEEQQGVTMVDGNNAVLFLQAGAGKEDYLNIVTGSRNYSEGRIAQLFEKFLHRSPSTLEMSEYTNLYISTNDYSLIQKTLLTTDEFFLTP
ncbi:MAG: hypothetical protein IT242_06020 [Bacteroidia bacterium]|nr:hypothetical protein [Bacteroidia bacterium]